MITTDYLLQYQDQIESIASFAKAVNFNPETDDFDLFMREWIDRGRKFQVWVADNKDEAIRMTKQALVWA